MVSIKKIKQDAAREAKRAAKVIKERNKPKTYYGPLLPGGRYRTSDASLSRLKEDFIKRNKRIVNMRHSRGIQYVDAAHGPILVRVIDSKDHPHNFYESKGAGIWADNDNVLSLNVGNYHKKRKMSLYNYDKFSQADRKAIKEIYENPTTKFDYKQAVQAFKYQKRMTNKKPKKLKK